LPIKDNPNTSLTHRTLGSLFWMFSGAGVQAVLRIIVLAVLARLLTPADFGLVSIALVVIGFVEFFSLLGVGPAIVQREQIEDRHLQTGFTISVLLGFLSGGFIWLFAPYISVFFRMPDLTEILRALIIVFPLSGLSVVAESLLQRELHFRQIALIQVFSYLFGYAAVGVCLAMMKFGVWALVIATIVQITLQTIILLCVQPHIKGFKFEYESFKELILYGGGFTITKIFNYLALQGDNLVVGRWLGADALGLYGRAYNLMTMPVKLLSTQLDIVLFPAMAKIQNEQERLSLVYKRGISLIALTSLPISAVMIVLAPEIVDVLLGPSWKEAVIPFQILAIGTLFRMGYKMGGALARAKGAVYRLAWRQGIYALFIVGGAWIGQHWGISGVAAGVVAALAVQFIITIQLGLSLISMRWIDVLTSLVPAVFLTVITGGAVWTVAVILRDFAMSSVTVLILSSVVTAVIGLASIFLLPKFTIGTDGVWLFQSLTKRFGFQRFCPVIETK